MVDLAGIRDWLKTLGVGRSFYIGKLDAKKEKSIGVYQRQDSGAPIIALGGLDNTKYDRKAVSVLVHWTRNAKDAEVAARTLFDRLLAAQDVTINDTRINIIAPQVPEPQDVGTDDSGVYERVIWFDLYYERR